MVSLNVVQTLTRRREEDDTEHEAPDQQRRRVETNPCAPAIAQRVIAAVPGRKPRLMDYDTEAQDIIVHAVPFFKLMISGEYAYPDALRERVWAKQAWAQATHKLQVLLAPDIGALQVIEQYAWNLRSELKTAAKSYVQGVFGFKTGTSSAVMAHNRDLANALLKDSSFTYQNRGGPEEQPSGLYEAEILQMVINRVYYKGTKDDGVILRQFYTPFPLPALALVISAIQCAIDKWSTGQWNGVQFREIEYKPIYDRHIKALKKFRDNSIKILQFDIVRDICSTISTEGWCVSLRRRSQPGVFE
ncbi:hypothetical protein C8Q80DRAFT_1110274 [Daedaleopsis nitida]|nr:hypothetical protein C8Q80DRAFT_1110274 [Daedaleopsis nitida]